MKKFLLLVSLFILFLSHNVNAAFCCGDPDNPGQDKCWNTGECCNGIWYESCYNFEISTSGSRAFRVGQKTPVVVYIKNTGFYTDSYTITGESDDSLILVDMSGATQAIDIGSGQIKKLFPRITVLSSTAIGVVTFRATSTSSDVEKSAILNVLESDNYLSLPEFSILGSFQLFVSIAIVYFISRQRYF